jgi:hypothetical protein
MNFPLLCLILTFHAGESNFASTISAHLCVKYRLITNILVWFELTAATVILDQPNPPSSRYHHHTSHGGFDTNLAGQADAD